MAFITVTGESGCRDEELARLVAQRLECNLVTETDLTRMMQAQVGDSGRVPERAWAWLAASVVAALSTKAHIVVSATGAELLARDFPAKLRFHVIAPEAARRNPVEGSGDRPESKVLRRRVEANLRLVRKQRFGQKVVRPTDFDILLNAGNLSMAEMVDLVETAVRSHGLLNTGLLSPEAAAEIQFQARMRLARLGISPVNPRDPQEPEQGHAFGHPSEQVFANLLDFYGIAWDYEPRSFPLQWDKDGKVSEAFTPDFYLPEFDLYVELTTMKQAHVTRKNRKIRRLKAIYPHLNLQVFYQKDVQDLVMKYGLPERLAR
jgi:hypothetical protein